MKMKDQTHWLPSEQTMNEDRDQLLHTVLTAASVVDVKVPDGPLMVVWQGGKCRCYSTVVDDVSWPCPSLDYIGVAVFTREKQGYSIILQRQLIREERMKGLTDV